MTRLRRWMARQPLGARVSFIVGCCCLIYVAAVLVGLAPRGDDTVRLNRVPATEVEP